MTSLPPTVPSAQAGVLRLLMLLAATLILALPALWNRSPLFYPDTPTYLRGAEAGLARLLPPSRVPAPWLGGEAPGGPEARGDPAGAGAVRPADPPGPRTPSLTSLEDRVVLAGRSVYYGALLLLAHLAGGLGWMVAFQALCLAWLLQLLLVERWGLSRGTTLAVTAALAVATPAGLYAGLLMPDLFAGLAILAAAALLVEGRRLVPLQRMLLCLLLLLAVCSHVSHAVLVAVVLAAALALRRWRPGWEGMWAPGAWWVAACLAGGIAAEVAFQQAVMRAVGAPPLRLPHLTAHLVDLGPGTEFLRAACPPAGAPSAPFAACAFVDRYPVAWTDFLFATDPARGVFAVADAPTRRRLSEEQVALALAVARHDPGGVARGLAMDSLRQLAMVRIDIWGLGPRELAMYEGRVPPDVAATLQASRGARMPQLQGLLSALSVGSLLAGLAIGAGFAWRRARAGVAVLPHRFAQFAALAVIGVIANAVVCATLAGPLDRFQARVAWVVPLLAMAAVAVLRTRRAALQASAAATAPRAWEAAAGMPPPHAVAPGSMQGPAALRGAGGAS